MTIPEQIAQMQTLLCKLYREFYETRENCAESLAEDIRAAAVVLEREIGPAVRERAGHYMLHNRDFDDEGQPNNRREI